MALDSLGLGLTLDTTLLAKADKTLENMHRNSQLIMQNLNRGFSAFNSGNAKDFTSAFDAIKKSMDTIKNSKVSVEFDTAGQDRFLESLNQIMEQVERIRQIGEVGDNKIKFFDPSTVKVTTESLTELQAQAQEIEEAFKEVREELSHAFEFGKDVSGNDAKITKLKDDLSEIGKAAGITTKDFSQMQEELRELVNISVDEVTKVALAKSEREKKLIDDAKAENSKISKKELDNLKAQDEELRNLAAALEEKKKAWEEASNILKKYTQQLEELSTLEAKKEAHDNLQLNRDKEKAYQELLAENRAQQKFAGATTAQQNAMIVSEEHKRLSEESKRIATLTKNYLEAVSNYEKYQNELSQLLDNIATVGKKRTSAQDEERTRLLQEIDRARSIINELKKEAPEVIEKIEAVKKGENTQKIAAESAEKVKASLDYAKVFSDNAKSIDEEIEAISMLKRARNALASDTTVDYDKEIAEANKRISKHEDHVKLLTQEQKESKTLEDSVISRYLRERKEADKLGDELRELNRVRKERGTDYSPEEKQNINALINRWRTLRQDISEIESNNAAHLSQLQEKYASQRAEDEIKIMLAKNEREKQEYAKLLDEKYALKKQREAMDEAGIPFYETEYQNNIQQEADIDNRIKQLRQKHLNDLADIDKAHNKKVNDDAVKERIASEKEKLRIAEEYAKKQREKAKKYGTISNASAERLIGVADKAQNVNQHKLAIEKLTQARNSLNITDKDYLKTVKKLNDAIKWHHIEVEIAEDKSKGLMQTHRGLMDIGGQLMRRLALVFSVSQLTQYFRKLVEVRGEFEKQEVALQTLLKSKYQANILMQQVTDLAVKSPFTLQQLIGYTKQLAAYQIEYKKLYSTTKMLADVSAGLGVEMDRLILAFGQVRAANYLRATEVRQFTEAGMDILGELAKYYSELEGKMVSVADVQERVTKRMVGFSDVEEVFKRVTSAGGIFYDMQAKQAETLSGQWSNLQDKIGIMFNEIGKGTDGLLKGIVRFLASIVDNWEKASTVLTAIVGSFVAVKINTALASKELIKFVRTMGLIKGRVKSVSILQTLGAVFVKLGKSIKSAALAMKGFAVSHPIITALTLLATLMGTVYKEWRRQEEAAKNVRKQYDDLSESVEKLTVAFNRMGREGNFEGQKKQLEELVTLANNEYQMNIKVNLEGATAEEVTQQFIELQQKMLLLNSFATDFNTDYAQSGKQTEESMKKYGEVAKETLKSLVQDAERVAFTLDKLESEGVKLTDSQVEARNKLAEPRQIDESELDYLQRLMAAFDLLTYEYENMEEERARALQGLDFDSEEYTKTAMDFTRSLIDIQDRMSELGLSIGDITKIYSKYNKAQGKAIKEYNEFLDKVEVPSFLTEEGKEERIKFAIDTYAAQNQWDEFMINLAYDLANKKFVINITPEVDLPSDDKLKAWQKTYNEKFAKYEGFTKIGKSDTTQAHQIDILNDAFKKQEELVKQIEKVGTQGAYQGYKLADEQKKLAQIVAQLNWFGIDPKTKGKDEVLENLKNQIGLIKEMNKEYEKLNKTFSKAESLAKVQKAYADTAKELDLDTSTMDFTDEGTIKSLEALLGKPEYAANEYVIELQKALDNLKVELGIEAKQDADKQLLDNIQELFDQYDLSLELKKLNIPSDLAKSLFDVDYLDLEGLNKAVQKQESKFIGTDMEEEYKKFLDKISGLQRKQSENEAKEFVNFLKKNLNEIQVIQDKGAYNIALADRLFGQGKITTEQYMSSIRQIVDDTNKEVARVNLDKFKDSATYIKAMGNLAAYSRDELEGMINALQGQVGANAGNMGSDEIRAYYEALERLIEQYDKIESPFQKGEINDLIEYLNLQKQLNQEKEKEAALEQRKAEINNKLNLLQAQLKSQQERGDVLGAASTQRQIKSAVGELKEVDGQIVGVASNILVISERVEALGDGMVKSLAVAHKIVNEIANVANAATKIFDDIKSAADALGADTESGGWVKAGYAMEMVGGVSSELTSGLASLASGDFAGALASVVGMVTKLISGFAKIHDQDYQDIIDKQAKEVERLGKAYEKLETATESAYSIQRLQQYNKELERNIELQIASYKAMIAAENAKKDTDAEQIKTWNEEIEALTEQWDELKQSLIEGVGGVSKDNYRSQTREFVDAWVSAFKETGNGLQGLRDNFKEFFDNIIAEQAALRVTEKFLAPFYDSLNTALDDLSLSVEESKSLREEADKIMPELSKALELIWSELGGSRGEVGGGGLSELQKGIQGITEDTAQIIEAYLNSIRGYVSEQVTHTKNIYNLLRNVSSRDETTALQVRVIS